MNRKHILALLSTGHAAEHWYIGILAPVSPFLFQDLNISVTQYGILFAGRSFFSAISSVGTGLVIDSIGRGKWVLVACLAGIAAIYGGIALTTSFWVLLPIFWVSGLITHMWHPPSMGLLGTQFHDRKGFALGVFGTGANIGQSLSPFVAGYLLLAVSWRNVLLINMGPLLVMATLLWIFLPPFQSSEREKQDSSRSGLHDAWRALVQTPALCITALISGAVTLSHHGLITFLPLLLAVKHGLGPEWVGLCIGFYSAISIVPETVIGFISDRIPRKRVLMMGAVGGGLTMIALPAVAHSSLVLIPLALIAIFLRSLRPVIFAYALEVSPVGFGGSTVGFIFTSNQVFSSLGPLAAGVLSDIYGFQTAFWMFGALSLMTLPLFALIPYSPPGAEEPPSAVGTDSRTISSPPA